MKCRPLPTPRRRPANGALECSSAQSGGVVKDDAKRMTRAAMERAHAMANADPTRAAHAGLRAIAHGKDHPFAVSQRHDVDAALPTRSTRREHELPAEEIAAGLRQQEGRLQRE